MCDWGEGTPTAWGSTPIHTPLPGRPGKLQDTGAWPPPALLVLGQTVWWRPGMDRHPVKAPWRLIRVRPGDGQLTYAQRLVTQNQSGLGDSENACAIRRSNACSHPSALGRPWAKRGDTLDSLNIFSHRDNWGLWEKLILVHIKLHWLPSWNVWTEIGSSFSLLTPPKSGWPQRSNQMPHPRPFPHLPQGQSWDRTQGHGR